MGRNNKKPIILSRKLKKDPGVPKLPTLKLKNDLKKVYMHSIDGKNLSENMETVPESSLAALASSAADIIDPTVSQNVEERSADLAKRQYIRTLYKVIEQSDVVIVVLDARDPEGCRCRIVEEEVHRRENEGKKLVFVLNKVDLVPQENAFAWLRYLRHTAPTIPFRSSTQQQSANLKSRSAPGLLNLIKSYRNGPASKITVGVVGYPNVGKSSLINSLKRSKVCAVGAEAGWTRDLQSVQIDRGIRIIDSPGVVFDDVGPESARALSGVLLRNVLKVEDIDDPLPIVEEIVKRTSKEMLQKIYKLPEWNNTLEFVAMVALSSGKLLKGGTADALAAARSIIQDWNNNKIPYFSVPPTTHTSSLPSNVPGAEDVGQLTIVQGGFGAAFDLGELYGEAMQEDTPDDGIMEEDGNMMESDDGHPLVPLKRSLSPESINTTQQSVANKRSNTYSSGSLMNNVPATMQKRTKLSYDVVLDSQVQNTLGAFNPLGRRSLRMNLKKERKAARRAAKSDSEGMTIDDVGA